MTGQQKKYVFKELVKQTSDPIQLIAYAFYKKHKDDRAAYFEQQFGAGAVSAHLETWHDSIANDPTQLQNYITTAKTFMAVITDEINDAAKNDLAVAKAAEIGVLNATHQQEISDLTAKVTNAEDKARKEWGDKMASWAVHSTTPGRFKKGWLAFIKWVGMTVAGAFGTAVVTGFIVAILASFNPSLSANANSIVKGMVDKLLPPDDPSGMNVTSFTIKNGVEKPKTPPAVDNKP